MLQQTNFTAEERAVARGLLRGERADQLARELRLSEHRVRLNIKHLQRKTHSNNRIELLDRLNHTI